MKKMTLGILILFFCSIPVLALSAPFAYISNSGSNTVSVIDTASNKVSATISVGTNPWAVGHFMGPNPRPQISANSLWYHSDLELSGFQKCKTRDLPIVIKDFKRQQFKWQSSILSSSNFEQLQKYVVFRTNEIKCSVDEGFDKNLEPLKTFVCR